MSGGSKSIAHRYGRKAGLLRHHLGVARYRLGLLSSLERVEWGSVHRLVFVCKGNICRSAYAEGKAKALGLPAASFGLSVRGESPANEVAIRAAAARGVDLSAHRTRSRDAVDVGTGDLLLAMELPQAKAIAGLGLPKDVQITLLGLWCEPPCPHIEDPYGLPPEYFSTCFGLIDDALNRMALRMASGARN
jgi:protein-tyrosine phosphatase